MLFALLVFIAYLYEIVCVFVAATTIGRHEKSIVIEDDDGYEICSDLEFQLFCNRKDEPCFVVTTSTIDNESETIASTNSVTRVVNAAVTETNAAPLVLVPPSVAVIEAEFDATLDGPFENLVGLNEADDQGAQQGPTQPAEKPQVYFYLSRSFFLV